MHSSEDFLRYYEQLSLERQKEIFYQVREEVRKSQKVRSFDYALTFPEVHEELRRIAADTLVPLTELAALFNPWIYSLYVARSSKCKMTRILTDELDRDIGGEVLIQSTTVVTVKAIQPLILEHRLGGSFELHVVSGSITAIQGSHTKQFGRGQSFASDSNCRFRLPAGALITYPNHPVSAWLRERGP